MSLHPEVELLTLVVHHVCKILWFYSLSGQMFQMDLTERAALHLARLKKLGYDVLASDDFAEIETLVQQTGKPFRSPMFDTRRNDFTEGRAFWLFLKKDGVIVGGMAAQYIPLGSENFENYVQRTSEAQYDLAAPLNFFARPVKERLKGNLIYFGDVFLTEGARGKRSVLREFCRLEKMLTAMTWPDFDWMFGHIPYPHRSLIDVYGFSLITHNAFHWNQPLPYSRTNDFALIYHSKSDLLHDLALGEADDAAENKG